MTAKEIQKTALELPETERAELAGALLSSLPAILVDADDGIAEAERRSKELDEDSSAGRSWEDIKSDLGR